MSRRDEQVARRAGHASAARWVVGYGLLCGGWLFYADGIGQAFGADYPWVAWLLRNDRWGLIGLSGLALYLLVARLHTRVGLVEMERAATEETLGNLMGSVPGIAYRCTNGLTRRAELISEGALELTGHRPQDFLGHSSLDLDGIIHESDRPQVAEELQRALEAGRRYRIIYRIKREGAEDRWVMDSGCGIDEVEGRYTRLAGLMVDVTTQKVVERRLEGQRHHLQEIVDARTRELREEVEERRRLEGRLRELTRRDGLTGLLNRRSMDDHLAEEVDRGLRYGGEFSVVMVDLDHFKGINDTYGHAGGDAVLRRVSRLLQEGVRITDKVFRYGGEEIALVLTGTGPEAAWSVADRLRADLAEQREHLKNEETGAGEEVQVTFSAGVASFPYDGRSPEALLAAADGALYEAKRAGRDRVMSATKRHPAPPPPVPTEAR